MLALLNRLRIVCSMNSTITPNSADTKHTKVTSKEAPGPWLQRPDGSAERHCGLGVVANVTRTFSATNALTTYTAWLNGGQEAKDFMGRGAFVRAKKYADDLTRAAIARAEAK